MRTRRIGLFGASLCTLVIGVGSAAWACVPGHDHTGANDTDHAAHAAAQAPAAPVITVAPPVEEPVPVEQQATASPAAAPVQSAPVTAAPVATRTTTAPVRTATAPVATPTPAAPVFATPAPAASVTPVPEAVAPATPATAAPQERVLSEVPASQESSGSGSSIGGVLLAGFGVAVLVLGSAAAIRWRRNVTPPSVLPD